MLLFIGILLIVFAYYGLYAYYVDYGFRSFSEFTGVLIGMLFYVLPGLLLMRLHFYLRKRRKLKSKRG